MPSHRAEDAGEPGEQLQVVAERTVERVAAEQNAILFGVGVDRARPLPEERPEGVGLLALERLFRNELRTLLGERAEVLEHERRDVDLTVRAEQVLQPLGAAERGS